MNLLSPQNTDLNIKTLREERSSMRFRSGRVMTEMIRPWPQWILNVPS